MKRIRYYIFLRDVALLALTGFGGPQVHLARFITVFVKKRKYLTEAELMELYSLCQILPGPTSTQTITSIGFKIGGANLAYLTLLIWILPAVLIMTATGIAVSYIDAKNMTLSFTRFIQPIAIGFIAYAAYVVNIKVIRTKIASILTVASIIISFFSHSPLLPPILLLLGGAATSFRYKEYPVEEKEKLKIKWGNFILWGALFIGIASLGNITHSLPILLLENFYRNGSLVYGGGQVLVPLLYTEFVEFKHYLSSEEFLSGYAIAQVAPGPVFAFSSYIGVLSMRDYGVGGQLVGGLVSTIGIFLPGLLFCFFIIRFWSHFKKYRLVKASLEGITAVSSGLVIAAAITLFEPMPKDILNITAMAITFVLLMLTKIPSPLIVLAGLLAGLLLPI